MSKYPTIGVSIPDPDLMDRMRRRVEELGRGWNASRFICWAIRYSLDHHRVVATDLGDRILVEAAADTSGCSLNEPVSSATEKDILDARRDAERAVERVLRGDEDSFAPRRPRGRKMPAAQP